MKLVLISLLSVVALAGEITVTNECSEPVFAATAWYTGGGADDLNGNTSWSKNNSHGWYRIGPYQKETFNTSYLRVEHNGVPLTRVQPEGNGQPAFFCMHPSNAFDHIHWNSSNPGNPDRNPVVQCLRTGQYYKAFEDVRAFSSYTIFSGGCNPSNDKEDPNRLRSFFRMNGKGYGFFQSAPGSRTWYRIDVESFNYTDRLWEEKRTDEFIVLKAGNTKYAIGYNGNYQVMYPNSSQWTNLGNIGYWSER